MNPSTDDKEAQAVLDGLGGYACDDQDCAGRAFSTGETLASWLGKTAGDPKLYAEDVDEYLYLCDVCGKGQWINLKKATRNSLPL